jgi:2-oxoisovalerate dehydrogenase E1 component
MLPENVGELLSEGARKSEEGVGPISVYRAVLEARFVDDKMKKLVRQSKGGTFQLSAAGHELVGVMAARFLRPGIDWGFPYYRDRAFAIGLGCDVAELFGAFLARRTENHSSGRMMPDHFSHKKLRIPCQSSSVGSQFLQATGTALSARLRRAEEVIYVSGGDGSTSQGDFHEMLNFACLYNLPLIVVIQDNGWAISVKKEEQTAGQTIAKMAQGYEGLWVSEIDGTQYEELFDSLEYATKKARSAKGPSLIVAHVPRLGPHSSSDDPQKYQDPAQHEEDKKRDPLYRLEAFLLDKALLTPDEIQQYRNEIHALVEDKAIEGDRYPFPEAHTARDHLFVTTCPKSLDAENKQPPSPDVEKIVLMDALNHALIEEMERDPGVIVFGEDVAKGKGGVFGITRTLTARFSEDRCFNTPLAESTIIGLAIGLSFDGFHKPVAEIQFADYCWPGMNQLMNELASICYRSNGEWHCPVVIRMPYGGYIQGGPYHSQSPEAFFAHCPGLKVLIPSHAADAKRLLKGAIRDPNPVIFLEHKALYRQRYFSARAEPSSEEILPCGQSFVIREGSDITYIGWGMTTVMGYEAAELVSQEGISVEVIDLVSISPVDWPTLLKSVQKTGKVLIAHEAPLLGGFGAELAARLSEEAFTYLDAPICRLGSRECPVPYSKPLEDTILLQKNEIGIALRKLAAY